MKGITMVKIDEYVDRRLAEKVEAVKSYIDLKIAELNGQYKGLEGKFEKLEGQYKGLEGQMQGLRDSISGLDKKYDGLRDSFEGLRSEIRASSSEMKTQYELTKRQYEDVMGLLRIVIERTSPDKIGFGPKEEDKK